MGASASRIPLCWGVRMVMSWCAAVTFGVCGLGCEEDKLLEHERSEIATLLRTGVTIQSDPFVRAETLRVLEMLADPTIGAYATKAVEDESSMVRVAAMRVLLAIKHKDAERFILGMYGRVDDKTRLALLKATFEYGSEDLQNKLIDRAIRSKSPKLKVLAFERGPIAQVNRAVRDKDEAKLKNELKPNLSLLVDKDDLYLAAASLKKLVELGDEARAQPLIEKFQNSNTSLKERLYVGRLLRLANVRAVRDIFAAMLVAEDEKGERKKLYLPIKDLDPMLVRTAVLGAVALGHKDLVLRAQGYLSKANEEDTIEVLESLAKNSSVEVTISLKIAMKDARLDVRHRAIELYGARPDAQPKALINAMRQSNVHSRKMLANILVKRFPNDWAQELKFQLLSEDNVDLTLKLLRDVLDTQNASALLDPLQNILLKLSQDSSKGARASVAAYLLLLRAPTEQKYINMLSKSKDVHTRYVFLEHLVLHRSKDSVAIFRKYFRDDLYALRLMSSAGLWRAYSTSGNLALPASKTGLSTKEP